MHPVAGKQVIIKLPKAEFGDEVVLEYGFTDKVIDGYRSTPRTRPVQVQIGRDGAPVGKRTIEPTSGWHRWRLPTEPGVGEVELIFETDAHLDSHLCVDLTTPGRGRDRRKLPTPGGYQHQVGFLLMVDYVGVFAAPARVGVPQDEVFISLLRQCGWVDGLFDAGPFLWSKSTGASSTAENIPS